MRKPHEPKLTWRDRARAKSARLRTLREEITREQVAGDGWIHCEECEKNELAALSDHHVTFRSQGGEDSRENLRRLCVECHGKEHGQNITLPARG